MTVGEISLLNTFPNYLKGHKCPKCKKEVHYHDAVLDTGMKKILDLLQFSCDYPDCKVYISKTTLIVGNWNAPYFLAYKSG